MIIKIWFQKRLIYIKMILYDFFIVREKICFYDRWNEVDKNNNIINYGEKENEHYNNKSNIISRNWRVFRTEKKTEYNHIINYDYTYEYEKHWTLFIPYTVKYKQPYRLVQNIYYKKEDKNDDLGYKKYGDWIIEEYGSTRRDYYTSRYRV